MAARLLYRSLGWLFGMVVRVGGERDLEIVVLRHQLAILSRGGKRPYYTTADRAFLAAASRLLPSERWSCFVVSPQTLRRWQRALRQGRRRGRRPGRPPLLAPTASVIVRLGKENPGWGYMRIQGELLGLGVCVSATTVANVLRRTGLGPAPRRIGPTWSQFLGAQAQSLLAGRTTPGHIDGHRDTVEAAAFAEQRADDPVETHVDPLPAASGQLRLVARLVPVPNRGSGPEVLDESEGRLCLRVSHRTRARDGPATQPCRHPARRARRRLVAVTASATRTSRNRSPPHTAAPTAASLIRLPETDWILETGDPS